MRVWMMLAAAGLVTIGCFENKPKDTGKASDAKPDAKAGAVADAGWEKYLLKAEPAGAVRQVKDVRDNAKDGDEVLVAGRVQDFVDDRAMFVLVDGSLKPCNEIPDDPCDTPWDYCCEATSVLKAHRFAVTFSNGAGATLKTPLKGTLKYLDKVVVQGRIRKSADGAVTLTATGLYNRGGGVVAK